MTSDLFMFIDPALRIALRLALAILFLSAATHKLRDFAGFRAALAGYELVPLRWLGAASWMVIALEASTAAALVFPEPGAAPALAGAGLLLAYTWAIAVNLRRGRRIDCGCAGPAGTQPLSAGLVARNATLIAVALAAALPATSRSVVWLDAVTVIAIVATLSIVYAAVNTVLANAPWLAALAAGHAPHEQGEHP